ncbi:hypothetical protein [Phaffia rhodozyma]|uniref:Something about silencing protein 4 domain-containing protein n=1 Tax=Phaffia rhodozyma TaxID=264483 RepID=A0A0F7SHK7_PHARH|nr:hypothetical protein [Phaffia rhodozyma]
MWKNASRSTPSFPVGLFTIVQFQQQSGGGIWSGPVGDVEVWGWPFILRGREMMLHRLLNPEVEEERNDASLNANPLISGKPKVASKSVNGYIPAFPSNSSSLPSSSRVPMFESHPSPPTTDSLTPIQKGKARAQSSSPLSSAADDNEDDTSRWPERMSTITALKPKSTIHLEAASSSTMKSRKISTDRGRQIAPAPRQVPVRAKRSSVSASATGLGGLSFMERKEIEEIVEECRERMVQDPVPALEDTFPPIKFLLSAPEQSGYFRVDQPKAPALTSSSNTKIDRSGFPPIPEAGPRSSWDSKSSVSAAPTSVKKLPTQSWKILDEETEAIVGGGRLRRRKESTTTGQQDTSDEYYTKLHRKYETFEKKQKRLEKEKWAHERYNLKKRIELIKSMEAKSFSALVNAIAEKTSVVGRPRREVDPEALREKLLEEAEVVLKRYDLLLPARDHSKPRRADHSEEGPTDILVLPASTSTTLLPSRVSSLRHTDGPSAVLSIKHRPSTPSSTASTSPAGQPTSPASPLPFKPSTSRKRRYSSVSVDSDEPSLIIVPHHASTAAANNIRPSKAYVRDLGLEYTVGLDVGHKPVITPKPRPRRKFSGHHSTNDSINNSFLADVGSTLGQLQNMEGEDLPGRDESGRFLPGFGGVQPARGEKGKFLPRDPTGPVRKRSSLSLKRSGSEHNGETNIVDGLHHEMSGDVEIENTGLVSANGGSIDKSPLRKLTTAPSRIKLTAHSNVPPVPSGPCLLIREALKHLPIVQSKWPASASLPSPAASTSPSIPSLSTLTPTQTSIFTPTADTKTMTTSAPTPIIGLAITEGAPFDSNAPAAPLPTPFDHLVQTPTNYVSPKHSTRGVDPRQSIAVLRRSRSNRPWGIVLPAAVTFKSDFDLDGDIWIPFLEERMVNRQQQQA